MLNLIRQLGRQNRAFLIACAFVLGGFQFLLCAIVSSIDIETALEQILAFAPPIVKVMVEQSMLGGSTSGVLAFGWNHPITHALAAAVPIALGARAIAGEVENGVIELVLAHPISRLRYLGAQAGFALLALLAVDVAGALGTVIGQRVFHIDAFGPARLALLVFNLLLLQSAIFGLTLLLSAFGRENGRVAMASVLLAVISFLVNAVASLWSQAAFMLPFSLHSYYDPRGVLVNQVLPATHVALLAAVALLGAGAAARRFQARDLP